MPAVASPVVCGVVALFATYLAYTLTRRARRSSVDRGFKYGQTVSASMVSLAHGTGDAQKTMGIITLVLITSGNLHAGSGPPVWVILVRRPRDRARHLHGRLADHPHDGSRAHRCRGAARIRGRDIVDGGAARLGASRLRAVDDAGRLRRHPRLRSGSQARAGALDARRADGTGVAVHAAGRRGHRRPCRQARGSGNVGVTVVAAGRRGRRSPASTPTRAAAR